MGIFNRNKKTAVETREYSEWSNPIMGILNLTPFSQYTTSKALKLSTVYRCVNLISDSIASMPLLPYTYKDKSGNITNWKYIDYSNNLYNLLNVQPNGLMGANLFKKLVVTNVLLKGNAYVLIDRAPNGNVMNLILLNSDNISVKVKGNDITYTDVFNKKDYDKSQIVHVLNYTENGIYGISTLNYAANTLGIAYNSDDHASNFFKGGGNLAGLLRPIAGVNINADKAAKAKESFINALNVDLQGTTNAIVVLDSGLEYQPISINPKDAQLLESRQFNVLDICRFFNVPPSLAFSETGKFSTAEQQQLDFLNNTLTPMCEKIENEFFRKLYLRTEWDISELRFNTENLMRLDAATKAAYFSTMFRIGAYTVNEIRERIDGSVPVVGGNRAFIEVNVQPTDALISEQQNVADPNGQIDNKLKSDNNNGQ